MDSLKTKLQEGEAPPPAQQSPPPAQQSPPPAQQSPPPAPTQQAVPREPTAEVLKSPSARGSKRPHPSTPVKPSKPTRGGKEVSELEEEEADDEVEIPKVMNFSDMTKLEKEKVRRCCTPKKGSGNLEVPENIFEMWKDAGKGRDNLFRMWAKAGGVKAGRGPNT